MADVLADQEEDLQWNDQEGLARLKQTDLLAESKAVAPVAGQERKGADWDGERDEKEGGKSGADEDAQEDVFGDHGGGAEQKQATAAGGVDPSELASRLEGAAREQAAAKTDGSLEDGSAAVSASESASIGETLGSSVTDSSEHVPGLDAKDVGGDGDDEDIADGVDVDEQPRRRSPPKKPRPPSPFRCPDCGIAHPAPHLLDAYQICQHCEKVLRWPNHLRDRMGPLPQDMRFRILIATYGDRRDAGKAVEITDILQRRVDAFGIGDRLIIRDTEDLREVFGDPCPGIKMVLVRYQHHKHVGAVRVWDNGQGRIRQQIVVVAPPTTEATYTTIHQAWYGNPPGPVRDRMAFDVTELVRGMLDQQGYNLLTITHDQSLLELFGNPCEGRQKTLRVDYTIDGRADRLVQDEAYGKLTTPIFVSPTPVISPLILILDATYGLTPFGKQERLAGLERKMNRLLVVFEKKERGLPITLQENKDLLSLCAVRDEFLRWEATPCRYVDITADLQRFVENGDGHTLELNNVMHNLNEMFTNPMPNRPKEIRFKYIIVGHDSERLTDNTEITENGYIKNFIRQRDGELIVSCKDLPNGVSQMEHDIFINAPKALSLIEVYRAFYGHRYDIHKVFDVSSEVNGLISASGGHRLYISTDDELNDMFGNPCPGVRKRLIIKYMTRGFSGTMRVDDLNGYLRSDLQIGYRILDPELLAVREKRAKAVKALQLAEATALQHHKGVKPSNTARERRERRRGAIFKKK